MRSPPLIIPRRIIKSREKGVSKLNWMMRSARYPSWGPGSPGSIAPAMPTRLRRIHRIMPTISMRIEEIKQSFV
jgi:hypothetical protein